MSNEMPTGFSESKEKLLFHYTYFDYLRKDREVIFECNANNITDADALYEAEIGEKPERQNNVGCSIVKN